MALKAAVAVLVPAGVSASPAPLVDVLFTAETGPQPLPCRCKTYPLGGWAQRLAVLDSLRAAGGEPLLVDTGGWLAGNLSADVAALTARAHALMGYDAINVGPEELALIGSSEMPAWAEGLPLVCGHPARPEGIPAFRVVEHHGRRVGIAGVARFDGDGVPDPAVQLGSILEKMPETDVVVVLLDGGLGPVNLIGTTHERAHVVLYGDGARTPSPVQRRHSIAAAPGTRGRYVGRLVLPRLGAGVADCPYGLVPVEADRRGPDALVRLALRAADLHEGTEALLEATFEYTD